MFGYTFGHLKHAFGAPNSIWHHVYILPKLFVQPKLGTKYDLNH